MKVKEIILHCSATKEGKDFSLKDIERWHKERGFRKIGYHYVIDRDGTIEKGRKENEMGSHCFGHNNDSIGICYIGGLDTKGKPKDTRTTEQKKSLMELVVDIMSRYNLTIQDVHCHNEYANKECPCFTIDSFRQDFIKYTNEKWKKE